MQRSEFTPHAFLSVDNLVCNRSGDGRRWPRPDPEYQEHLGVGPWALPYSFNQAG